MTYQEAQEYIQERNKLGSVLGLDNIRELMKRLDNPQNKLPVVHIAGTNGKGSILAFLDSILRDAGFRVGRYISPTIFSYLERFQINGTYMPEQLYANYIEQVSAIITEMERDGYQNVTAFEIETAISFLYFYDEKVDFLLLETGMGGRLDATNVVERPICTILASISYDHMNILGNTIEAIATEKCGILRDGVPCVVYPENAEAMPTIQKECSLHNVEVIVPNIEEIYQNESGNSRNDDIKYEKFGYEKVNYKSALIGEHQIYNAVTSIETAKIVSRYLKIHGKNALEKVNYRNGLHNVDWKGRFEILQQKPYVIRDGAHNYDAAIKLKSELIKHFTNHRIIYIIGVLGDKEHAKMLAQLAPLACKAYVFTVPDNARALPAKKLAAEVRLFIKDVEIVEGPEQALEQALRCATEDDVIVAFGSLYYIGRIGVQDGYK